MGKLASLIFSIAVTTSSLFCGLPSCPNSRWSKLWIPILIRSIENSRKSARFSWLIVAGDVSKLLETASKSSCQSSASCSKTRLNCWTGTKLGVPPPTAKCPIFGRVILFDICRDCLSVASRVAFKKSAFGRMVVNRLQNPHRISQNGKCTYRNLSAAFSRSQSGPRGTGGVSSR